MSLSTYAWIELDEAKRHLAANVNSTTQDALITELVNAACRAVEGFLEQGVVRRAYTEIRDGEPISVLLPYVAPANVTAVYEDAARAFGAETLVPAASYAVPTDDEGEGSGGRMIRWLDGYLPAEGVQTLKLVYEGGWTYTVNRGVSPATVSADKVPAAIRQATLMALSNFWQLDGGGKGLIGIASASQQMGGSIAPISTIELSSALPQQARQLLERYRSWRREVL